MSSVAVAVSRVNSQTISQWLTRRWFMVFALIYGSWVLLPWLAPLLMEIGWTTAGRALYFVYSFFCHQLPERSFFLLGREVMYPLAEIQAAWRDTLNPMVLRAFIGNDVMGWKVAWSDRMVSFYTSVWIIALAWWPIRNSIKPLPWWALILLVFPMALDGLTHTVSDFSGIGLGFRDTNAWLYSLAGGNLPIAYAGDALGSFNSWARVLTGLLAGLGLVWFAFPYVERSFAQDQR